MLKYVKPLIAAVAASFMVVPAQAQDISGRITIEVGDSDYHRYRDNDYRERRYARDVYRRYFRQQPSYYPGRCSRREIVVTDPYTGRRVCMSRWEYRRYQQHRRHYRF